MRLVVWNCWGGLDGERAHRLLALEPDVAVISEAGQVSVWPEGPGSVPSGYVWQGASEAKGLAVMTFGAWSLERSREPLRVPWVLPVEISGPVSFRLLGMWTVQRRGWPSYAGQVEEAIAAYQEELAQGATVLAGDFNCAAQTKDPSQHLANVARLEDLGVVSAYHVAHEVEPGDEWSGTLYWRWQEAAAFHCDFGFVPAAWSAALTSVEVGGFGEWVGAGVSDHVPVVIDLDL